MLLENEKNVIEALFFIQGNEGISLDYYVKYSGKTKIEVKNTLNIFMEEYNKRNSVFLIKRFGNTYKMLIKNDIYKNIKENLSIKKMTRLSKASLETLSIIAYNQPISKMQIEEIRGINSDTIIYNLLEKGLIYSEKTLDKIGKPKLYETTDLFLDIFNMESLNDLPKIKDVDLQ